MKTSELPARLWRLLRHDIGRKLTALAFALTLWTILERIVTDETTLTLPVKTVPTRDEADRQRLSTPAIYLVVPDTLLVRRVSASQVTLHVKGLADDVHNLNLNVVLPFEAAQLGAESEKTFDQALDRELFKSRERPTITEFRAKPTTLSVTLAPKRDVDTTLGSLNVTTEGRPKDGYYFKESRILVRPDQVRISGPSAAVTALRDRPELLHLDPVRLEGRSTSVVQLVGLSQQLLDDGLTLETPGNQVEVTIFLEPEDMPRDLLSVPVNYRNEDVLATRTPKQKCTSKDPSLDLRVTGPPAEIGALTKEELLRRIDLVFDFREATLPLARAKVHVFTEGLSDNVKVRLLGDDVDPFIEYRLEELKDGP